MRKMNLFFVALIFALPTMPVGAQPTIEGILESSPISCFYMMMHGYHEQLDYCEMQLKTEREQRFSRMNAAMEDYILKNARLDPSAIIANARGAAKSVVTTAPVCSSGEFEENRQAMFNITTAEAESLLYEQLATNALLANGSCY